MLASRFRSLAKSCALSLCIHFLSTTTVSAAFQVFDWRLRDTISDSVDVGGQFNNVVTNRYMGILEGRIAMNLARTSHDYSWLMEAGTGHLNTAFTHTIRDPHVRTVSDGIIRFTTDAPITVNVDSVLTYAHTPGEEHVLGWTYDLVDFTVPDYVFVREYEGGNGTSEPSAGQFTSQAQYSLLAFHEYRFHYNLDIFTSQFWPVGDFDASGFLNLTFLPEPSTLALLLPGIACTALRRRRHRPR